MPIQGKQVFGDDIQKIINDLNEGLIKINTQLKEMSGYGQKISGAKNIKELKTETDGLNKVNTQLKTSQDEVIKAQIRLQEATRKRKADLKTEVQLENSLAGSLDNKRAKLKQMIAQYSSGENTSRKFRKEITTLRKEVEKKEKSLGIATRGVGRYTKGVQTAILKVGGFYMAIKGIITGIGKMIKITSDFEEQMDTTQAILGANEEEMRRLERAARDLGAGSSKTASEAGKLQEELGKLGFTVREVLLSGGGILALAEATKSDLGEAARVAASTIRGFGKDAKETNHIVDVMAKSFTSTGLNLQKFETGMANAQVAAKSTGVSLEKTTAMLGAIVDTGTDASKAGTDLRVIFGKLAKQNISLDDAFAKVNKSGNKVVTAMELVGDRAYSSLITLSEQTDKVNQLSTAFENADGTASAMAKTMKDNLKGDIDRAKSAWEEFVLSVDSGNGVITKSVRGSIRMFTGLSNWLARLNKDSKELALIETMDEAAEKANKFVESFAGSESNEKIGQIKQRIEEINKEITKLGISDDDLSTKEFNRKMALLENERTALKDHVGEIESIEKEALKAKLQAELLAQGEKEAKTTKQDEENRLFETAVNNIVKKYEDLNKKIKPIELVDEEALDADLEYALQMYEQTVEGQKGILYAQLQSGVIAKQEYADKIKAIDDEIAQNEIDNAEKTKQEKLEKLDFYLSKTRDIGQESLNFAGALYQREIDLTQNKIDKGLISEKKGAIEIAKIQRKQAILDKTSTLFGITINTALAVAKVWGQTGVAGIIAQVAPIAMGLLQAGTVLAQPLPEIPTFNKGMKKGEYSGIGIIGDAPSGSSIEILKLPNNQNFIFDKPTAINIPYGSEIIPEKQIQTELANLAMRGENVQNINIGGISKKDFELISQSQTDKLLKGIKNMPQPIFTNGRQTGVKQGVNRTNCINKRFRHV
jgi:hypothetical protein